MSWLLKASKEQDDQFWLVKAPPSCKNAKWKQRIEVSIKKTIANLLTVAVGFQWLHSRFHCPLYFLFCALHSARANCVSPWKTSCCQGFPPAFPFFFLKCHCPTGSSRSQSRLRALELADLPTPQPRFVFTEFCRDANTQHEAPSSLDVLWLLTSFCLSLLVVELLCWYRRRKMAEPKEFIRF